MRCLKFFIYEKLLLECMFFIMKNDIAPVWEAPENIDGGCFSFKIQKNMCLPFGNLLYIALLVILYLKMMMQ